MKLKKMFILSFIFLFFITTNIYAHQHNSNCYEYDNHTHMGNPNINGDCYTTPIYHQHNSSCYQVLCASNNECLRSTLAYEMTCPNSNCISHNNNPDILTITETKIKVYNTKCLSCQSTSGKIGECLYCGYKINEPNNHNQILTCGKTNETIESYSLSCGLVENQSSSTIICDKIIVGIEAENNPQYKTINKNIIITYLDGHTEKKVATNTTFDEKMIYNGESITFYYDNYITYVNFYSNMDNNNDLSIVENINNSTVNNETTSVTIVENEVMDDKNINITEISQIDVEINEPEINDKNNGSKLVEIKDPIIEELEKEVEISTEELADLEKKPIPTPIILTLTIVFIFAIIIIIPIISRKTNKNK